MTTATTSDHGADDVVFDGIADAEDEEGEARATAAPSPRMPSKTSLNLGMTRTIRTPMMAVATTMTAHGIKHGGDDLAFDLLRLFHEFGQALEDDFEHAADFAGLDHVDEEAVEDLGMLGQGLGKGAAAFDGHGQLAEDALEVGVASPVFRSTRKPRSRGRPACTSVANWRVKVLRTLDLTRPLRPGILI